MILSCVDLSSRLILMVDFLMFLFLTAPLLRSSLLIVPFLMSLLVTRLAAVR